jgi:hypothetical protein
MSNKLRLYLKGGRFDKVEGIPLESLPAVGAVGALMESIARDLFFAENPDRKRVPARFGATFSPAITRLSGGSADCDIGGWESVEPELSDYYDDAQSETFSLFQALADDDVEFPSWCSRRTKAELAKALGMLRGDESLKLSVEANGVAPEPVTLGVAQRDKATAAATAAATSTEEMFSIAGRIYRIDNDPWAVGIKVREGGHKLVIPIADTLHERARLEFDSEDGHLVLIQGRADRDQDTGTRTFVMATKIQRIEGPAISARLAELSGLTDGWIDDESDSRAPSQALCRWVERQLWEAIEASAWNRPLLFPTRSGGVDAAWRFDDVTLKACFTSRPLEVHFRAVDLASKSVSTSEASRSLASLMPWAQRVLERGA